MRVKLWYTIIEGSRPYVSSEYEDVENYIRCEEELNGRSGMIQSMEIELDTLFTKKPRGLLVHGDCIDCKNECMDCGHWMRYKDDRQD